MLPCLDREWELGRRLTKKTVDQGAGRPDTGLVLGRRSADLAAAWEGGPDGSGTRRDQGRRHPKAGSTFCHRSRSGRADRRWILVAKGESGDLIASCQFILRQVPDIGPDQAAIGNDLVQHERRDVVNPFFEHFPAHQYCDGGLVARIGPIFSCFLVLLPMHPTRNLPVTYPRRERRRAAAPRPSRAVPNSIAAPGRGTADTRLELTPS